ncbi:MAG: prolyl oligopeptidase family serine peptidase [Pseudomonadota bacterium]|nr:prolyl oligopeptidase family serine peptidase [Pseudomonadota bacterium]
MTEPPAPQTRNPLHGMTLEAILVALVDHYGWSGLGERIAVNCFRSDPTIKSSLKFLRKTPWAREKVESLYLFMRRERARTRSTAERGEDRRPVRPRAAAPFGSWPSPITAKSLASATLRLGQIALRGQQTLWTEGRPWEQGRNTLVECDANGSIRDLTPAACNVRTLAHEYGGGAFVALPDGAVFSNFLDQQLYRIGAGGQVHRLTSEPGHRYADAVFDPYRQRLVAVREDHRREGVEPVTTLVSIGLADGAVDTLAQGHDFFSSPVLSPDGGHLAWLSWDHPNMPWDESSLWLAELDAGVPCNARIVAGGPGVSVFQPAWSPRGDLHFVSDATGWWNLYRLSNDGARALHPMSAEFGRPQWAFGMSTYGFDAAGRIVCVFIQGAVSRLAVLDPQAGTFQILETPFVAIDDLRVGSDFVAFVGATATEAPAVVRLDLTTHRHVVLRRSNDMAVDPTFSSRAEAISFPSADGSTAHAFYYPPTHPGFHGPAGERPPLLVLTHGGPTGACDPAFKWAHQFWTSRGFSVVDVNYGGSSGHGRAYRERLDGRWGIVDVDDAIHAARYLIARGDAHPDRVAIRGSSAGGYTTLCALTFHRFFKAGASHFGIGDLEALVADTHKFESRYLDRLIGPYPEARAVYRARSPVLHTDRLASPMILFQGAEDKAVPPAQAQAMYEAVSAAGQPVAYLLFEGEQHGFRRSATIERVLEAELYFYGKVFGFTPADPIEPVDIRNLPAPMARPPDV